jgi:hypothetical protein
MMSGALACCCSFLSSPLEFVKSRFFTKHAQWSHAPVQQDDILVRGFHDLERLEEVDKDGLGVRHDGAQGHSRDEPRVSVLLLFFLLRGHKIVRVHLLSAILFFHLCSPRLCGLPQERSNLEKHLHVRELQGLLLWNGAQDRLGYRAEELTLNPD